MGKRFYVVRVKLINTNKKEARSIIDHNVNHKRQYFTLLLALFWESQELVCPCLSSKITQYNITLLIANCHCTTGLLNLFFLSTWNFLSASSKSVLDLASAKHKFYLYHYYSKCFMLHIGIKPFSTYLSVTGLFHLR